MKRIINLIIIVISFIGFTSFASNVDIKVSAPGQVSVGERFRLTYQINADVDQFSLPTMAGLQVLGSPSRSQSSSIQIINGKVTQDITITYSYILVANTEGELTIPPATATVNDKKYTSASRKIFVGKASAKTANTSHASQNVQGKSTQNNGQIKKSDVYIKAFVNKKDVYLGEQLIVTYRIYTKVPVSNLSIDKLSSFSGFWSVDLLGDQKNLKQNRQIINGEEYIVADLKKSALFPQKTGDLDIDPMALTCMVQVQTQRKRTSSNDPFFDSFFNDPFFNNSVRNVEKSLVSNKLKIHVKDLPAASKPVGFNGAVGQLSLGSNIDHKEVMANEAITVKYTISGKGNIDLLPDLKVKFPPDFEVYDPKITTKTRNNNQGVSGYKTYEYTVIPRSKGTYEIPLVSFSYFDPTKKKYELLTSDSYQVKVNKSTNATNNVTYAGTSKEDIRYIGKDIRYIYLMPFQLEPFEHFFFGSSLFFILLFSPLVLVFLIVLFWKREKKRRGNTSLMKNRNATKVAKKRLKKAYDFMKNHADAEFYNELGQALWGYVSDKFSIPLADLSVNTAHDKLEAKGVADDVIQEFVDTLNNCEFARFAPGDKDSTMEKVYQQGLEIISKIEDQLK